MENIEIQPILEENRFFIPDIKLIGYGRSQTYQVCCLKCGKLEFNISTKKTHTDLFCEKCYNFDLITEKNISSYNYVGNIIGWEIKSASEFVKRSHYNYKKIYKRDEYTCQYCEYNLRNATEFRPLHIDHIKPWSASGSNKMDNLCVSCSKCNLHASDKWFQSFWEKKMFILGKI